MLLQGSAALRYVQGDGADLPFPDGAFDGAVTVAALHHIFRASQGGRRPSREMLRVTGPAASMIIWDHNPLNPYWPFLMRRLPQDDEDTRLVPAGEILRALDTAGADDVRSCAAVGCPTSRRPGASPPSRPSRPSSNACPHPRPLRPQRRRGPSLTRASNSLMPIRRARASRRSRPQRNRPLPSEGRGAGGVRLLSPWPTSSGDGRGLTPHKSGPIPYSLERATA